MENKINIAEILRNKPHGIKLYSPIFGDCTFCYIKDETSDICVRRPYNEMSYFNFEGLYNTAGECLLFPSKKMRDWSKFAWKKGDVLTNSSGFKIFFDKWVNDDYTKFLGKIKLLGDSHGYDAAFYNLVPEEKALEFIKSVEEINNGILNRETLEIERQHKFKPFDKVLCRDYDRGKWGINFFSHYDESSDYPFVCIKGVYRQCIPYNDMTKHLLDTTGEWKGGE